VETIDPTSGQLTPPSARVKRHNKLLTQRYHSRNQNNCKKAKVGTEHAIYIGVRKNIPLELTLNYADLAKNVTILSSKEQRAIVAQANGGCKASRKALVESNIRLAINIARKNTRNGIDHDDLVSVAAGSILECIRTYDSEAGAAFSTHCRQRMLADVQAFVRAQTAVSGDTRVKRSLYGKIQKLNRQGIELTVDNVSRVLSCTQEDARTALALLAPSKSMSAPVGSEDGKASFGDTLAARSLPQDVKMDRTRKSEAIVVALSQFCDTLSPRDLDIFRSRNLADYLGNEPTGQQEIAEIIGVSKQRVGQIEKALTAKCADFFKNCGLAA